jgi:hypothetical protein
MTDAPTLQALARALERSQRRVGELETLVRQLAADVTTLARSHPSAGASDPAAGEGGRPVGGWLGVSDPDVATGGLQDLMSWVEAVYLWYPDAELPSCWLWHPAVVEELWWLHGAYASAFDESAGSWSRIGDWHDRFRPGVVRRLHAAVGGCELALHTPDSTLLVPPVAPLPDAVSGIAHSWTNGRRLPEPTPYELLAAARHEREQHRKNHR